jgi:hypothetical protein
MGLKPDEFWRLTPHQFWIKHRAFARAEDRLRADLLEHLALRLGQYSKKTQGMLYREVHARRRYPIKPWLNSE